MNTFGTLLRLTTFGESHGPAVGAVVDGCPAGVPLTVQDVQHLLNRRRPGQSTLTTTRDEADAVEVLSGVYEGKTLGTPLAMMVRNTAQRSQDYELLKTVDRPGHADATWRNKFQHRDHRGGGRTSARETVGRVMGGAVALALLQRDVPSARVVGFVSQVGPLVCPAQPFTLTQAQVDVHPVRCPDAAAAQAMAQHIELLKSDGNSVGGVVSLHIVGLPVGLGEPVFGKLKSQLAAAMTSVGAVTGVTVGSADMASRLALDGRAFHARSEVYGGIQGGISNGDTIELHVSLKPPATLGEHAQKGRHDPCVLPRAVPILEAMAALVVADLWLQFCARRHTL